MSRWRAEYDDGIWRFYRDGMELGLYEKGDVVIDALNNAESRIDELEAELDRRIRMPKDLWFQVAELSTRVNELEAAQRWIPVGERLPEIINGMEYYDAVVEGEEFVEIALWDGWHKTWNLYDGGDSYSCTTFVTHWRERPTLPEVYGKEREE